MFCLESAIPVHFGIIKAENAISLLELHTHIWITGKKFVLECAVLVRCTNIVDFVDDGADILGFVKKHFRYEAFVGQVLVTEV